MSDQIVNKVAQSGIVTLNLEHYFPEGEASYLDIKDQLFMGMILKEKDFRAWVKEYDWDQYDNKYVGIGCSADAIIPTWAYMLLTSKLQPVCKSVFFGTVAEFEFVQWERALSEVDPEEFRDKKVVIKGCSDKEVPPFAYVKITELLIPVVQSLMYGEPCSTVPVYKKKKV